MDAPLTKQEYYSMLAAQEVERRNRARNSLIDFVLLMHSSGEKDFAFKDFKAHHHAIYDALQRFADEEFDNLLILMPPGAGKSVLCDVQFPLWYWFRNPSHNIICASNTQNLADDFSRRRRSCAQTKEFQKLGVTLTKESVQVVQNNHGGHIYAHGMESSVVGRRANLTLIDDPIKDSEEAASENRLKKLMEWIDNDLGSRKVFGAKELMVTTRWTRNDPAGVILDRIEKGKEKGWHVIRMPLICDSEDDPVGRKIGEQLWPEGFDKNYVRKAKRDPLVFQTMYQQLPYIQDGDWVGENHLHIKKGNPDLTEMKIVIGCDLALTQGGKADYTVFAVVGIWSGHFHIIEIRRNRHTADESVDTLFDLCSLYPQATELLIDDDGASKVFKEMILRALKEGKRDLHIAPVLMPMKGLDKESRAVHLRSLFHQDRVSIWQREWTPILVQEVMGFPDGCKHDDMIDALGLVAKRSVKYGNFFKEEKIKVQPSDAILTGRLDDQGRYISNMTLNKLFESSESEVLNIGRRRI